MMNFTSEAIEQNFYNNELVTVEVKVIKDVPQNSLGFQNHHSRIVSVDDNVGILDNVLQINQSCLVSQGI